MAYSFLVVRVTVGNHKDACPLVAIEAREEAEWMDSFTIIIKGVEWDLENGSSFKDSKLLVLLSSTDSRTVYTGPLGESKF